MRTGRKVDSQEKVTLLKAGKSEGLASLGTSIGRTCVGKAGRDFEVHRRESGEFGRGILLVDRRRCVLRGRSCCI